MQGYASLATAPSAEVRSLDPVATLAGARRSVSPAVLDELVAHLADLVAEKLAARLEAPPRMNADEWLDSRRAADYLGIHRDSLRRLAADGTIPAEQTAAGCKLFFRRRDLDEWRCPGLLLGLKSRRHG